MSQEWMDGRLGELEARLKRIEWDMQDLKDKINRIESEVSTIKTHSNSFGW